MDDLRPRFERLWAEWDRRIEEGGNPVDLIREMLDEDILELLASGRGDRDYERDVLMTELQNRLVRARRELDAATEAVVLINERIREYAAKTHSLAQESRGADEKLMRHRNTVEQRSRRIDEARSRHDADDPA